MKPLPTTFTKYGHLFTQIIREEGKALYERTLDGRHICYELIKIRKAKACVFHGKEIPEREAYPGESDFGVYGWSLIFHSRDKALSRFFNLNGAIKKPDQGVSKVIVPDSLNK